MAQVEFISRSAVQARFVLKGTDVAVANALRRAILSEVPNVAVRDDVKIAVNTTSMHNEFMAKRICLIPLCFDEDEVLNDVAKRFKFVIDKRSASINGDKLTTRDIAILEDSGQPADPEFHRKIFPDPPILIARLKQGEHVQLEFSACVGTAMEHCKFSPVSTCAYFNTLDEAEVAKARAEVARGSGNGSADVNKFETLTKYKLFQKNEMGEPCSFTFDIVSECRLSVGWIVDQAFAVLQAKLSAVAKKTQVSPIADRLYTLVVPGEDHTVGNLVQVFVYNTYVRKNRIVDFIGYFEPHPLTKEIVFKVRFLEGVDNVPRFWDEALRLAGAHLAEVREVYAAASALPLGPLPKKKTSKKKTTL
jgi:DNA-directed RNA polymerase subunit L